MPYGYAPECKASAFCVYELQLENYSKHLANSNRSTPLSESRARNLSSLVFVVRQQYGANGFRRIPLLRASVNKGKKKDRMPRSSGPFLLLAVPSTTSLDRYSALESARLVENEARYYDCSDRKATKSGPDTGFCLPRIAQRRPFLPVSSS
jgi:hypothetical protein